MAMVYNVNDSATQVLAAKQVKENISLIWYTKMDTALRNRRKRTFPPFV